MKVIVVGAGIVGLATAARLAARGDEVIVVDKEDEVAAHQTGRNSGVIHSGLYYSPGSLKARLGAAGSASMTAFAAEHGVAVRTTGKLVVATDDAELERLDALADRGLANGVPVRRITPTEARTIEPNVACVGALHVASTGIVDYRGVCRVLAGQVTGAGGRVLFGRTFLGARTEGSRIRVRVLRGHGTGGRERVAAERVPGGERADAGAGRELTGDALVVCGGLHADRLATACGVDPGARIVPFRGEYYELTPEASGLVNGLIYPVPDPRFPFLGVHLTAMISGGVHAGPNAVLALAREGYRRDDVRPADVVDALSWPGLWRLGVRNVVPGAWEAARSVSKELFARSVARLVPDVTADDLVPAPAGVRAQALRRDGALVDDFLVATGPRQVHVINAPSPAATAALEIAKHVERELAQVTG